MPTKRDIIDFEKFITTIEEEFDEFFDDKLGDIEIYLQEKGFGEYTVIYETFDKIEESKDNILYRLKRLKKGLSRILKSI